MISRYEAYMDGIALSSIDPAIYVLDIQPGEVRQSVRTSQIARRAGARITDKRFESTSVSIVFEIHEYDTVKRQEICQKVQRWANGSILTVSDRPGQELKCVCEVYPKANAKTWTEPLTVGFTAYNPPYWQESIDTSLTVTSSTSVYIPGNAPESLVSAVVTVGASLSSATLAVGSKSIVLSGISASANDVIYVSYDEDYILSIKLNSTSILDKRTADSADDLVAKCGEYNTFSVSSNLSAVFSTKGCWL